MSTISLTVNGQRHTLDLDPAMPLLYVLSDELQLRGPKFGCGLGQCGACTALVGGRAIRSCVTTVGSVGTAEITTLEGLATSERPHPIQQAFIDHNAFQCSYCTPGFILSTKCLLDENPRPTAEEVRHYLAGNLCRCGSYYKIQEAVLDAATRSRG